MRPVYRPPYAARGCVYACIFFCQAARWSQCSRASCQPDSRGPRSAGFSSRACSMRPKLARPRIRSQHPSRFFLCRRKLGAARRIEWPMGRTVAARDSLGGRPCFLGSDPLPEAPPTLDTTPPSSRISFSAGRRSLDCPRPFRLGRLNPRFHCRMTRVTGDFFDGRWHLSTAEFAYHNYVDCRRFIAPGWPHPTALGGQPLWANDRHLWPR